MCAGHEMDGDHNKTGEKRDLEWIGMCGIIRRGKCTDKPKDTELAATDPSLAPPSQHAHASAERDRGK